MHNCLSFDGYDKFSEAFHSVAKRAGQEGRLEWVYATLDGLLNPIMFAGDRDRRFNGSLMAILDDTFGQQELKELKEELWAFRLWGKAKQAEAELKQAKDELKSAIEREKARVASVLAEICRLEEVAAVPYDEWADGYSEEEARAAEPFRGEDLQPLPETTSAFRSLLVAERIAFYARKAAETYRAEVWEEREAAE